MSISQPIPKRARCSSIFRIHAKSPETWRLSHTNKPTPRARFWCSTKSNSATTYTVHYIRLTSAGAPANVPSNSGSYDTAVTYTAETDTEITDQLPYFSSKRTYEGYNDALYSESGTGDDKVKTLTWTDSGLGSRSLNSADNKVDGTKGIQGPSYGYVRGHVTGATDAFAGDVFYVYYMADTHTLYKVHHVFTGKDGETNYTYDEETEYGETDAEATFEDRSSLHPGYERVTTAYNGEYASRDYWTYNDEFSTPTVGVSVRKNGFSDANVPQVKGLNQTDIYVYYVAKPVKYTVYHYLVTRGGVATKVWTQVAECCRSVCRGRPSAACRFA